MPLLIGAASILLACTLQFLPYYFPALESLERFEWMTYDWRVRQAAIIPGPASDQLGFVFIGNDAIDIFSKGRLGNDFRFGLYWPRQLYGRVVRELHAQGATAVGLDVLFGERRIDHPPIATPDGLISSDVFFQRQLVAAENVILASTAEVVPDDLFRFAAAGMGDISTERDADGVLRRARVARPYRIWHRVLADEARLSNWDLEKAVVKPAEIVVPCPNHKPLKIALTPDGLFDPSQITGAKGRIVKLERAFTDVTVWHLGVVLAARALGADLAQARIEPEHQRIVLVCGNGVERLLPIDRQGRLLIDWSIRHDDQRLTKDAFETLVAHDILRERGTNIPARFEGKTVLVGSVASGNELSDRGATPLEKDTFLTSNHWNVMNSILTGRFVRACPPLLAALVIALLGAVSAWITSRFPTLMASGAVLAAAALYTVATVIVFIHSRLWLPVVSPVVALLLTHVALMSYQAFFEQSERRRVRHIFSKIVSPNIVHELLRAEKLALGGARREISVMFADVRGFTEMTDMVHARAEEYVREHRLSSEKAQAHIEAQAQEVLQSVNLYLGIIADIVKRHEGTLDKYIGDCVMAFWGAPTPNDKHALSCVRAAIEAQRAIETLNQTRAELNRERSLENTARATRGEAPLSMLHTMALGIGINTGIATAGLMGSDEHLVNFTIFGREVNVAARLEAAAVGNHILIGEATYAHLLGEDPAIAATCLELPAVTAKGIRDAVKCFEVQWGKCDTLSAQAAA